MKRSKIVRYTSEQLAALRQAGKSQTDWARVAAMRDEDIICDEDSPELDETFFAHAVPHLPVPKARVTLRLDQDVLAWFKAQGQGYQSRINAILRDYMEAQHVQTQ
jgi:uncharacterized protein (DUF4415 family)